MASSGNFNTNKYTTQSNGTIGLNLSWSITSQSTANNTSTIHWILKSNGTMSSGYYVKGGPITVVIGGVTVLNITSRINVNGSGGFSRSGNITIKHGEDGTKSVSMSVKAALYSGSVNCTGSKTYSLNKIFRYALIESATDFYDDTNPVIVYSNPAGGEITSDIYVRLKWLNADGVTEETTDWSPQLSDDGGSYTYNLNSYRDSLRTACPNSNTLSVTVDLKSTMNNTEYHDTKVITMSIANANPTISSVAYMDSNSSVSAITHNNHIIVQAQSDLYFKAITIEAYKYAQVDQVWLNFNGTDYEMTQGSEQLGIYADYTIYEPNYSGTYTATVTVIDTRGNKGTKSIDITITPWSKPTAECTLERINGFETNTILTVKGTISTVTGSTMSISERHRIVNDTWSSSASVSDNTPTTLSLDNTKEWEVEVSISDSFTTSNPTTYILTVGKGIPIMFIDTNMNSVGINCLPTNGNTQLWVDGDIAVTETISCNLISARKMRTSRTPTTFTKSSGSWTFNSGEYTKSGNTIQLRLSFHGGSSNVAVGSNAIVGTVGYIPYPPYTVRLFGYYSGTVLMGELTSQGGFNVRVLGQALNLSSSNTATLSGVYITEE